ncbi:tetratricopeptide repeat protein [Marinomonas posidonica]|uniref:Tetratricopeptide TPR_1 repeat-containing protein n=1 Tax=Marinomonas posidonica (strain CECT 7376 / NCIMB 14433 / IVIA-Po-181) TaxID=491952 RepID=F6CWZ9_MARPP|nr:tetratricopeptide repeat protein [Marinomonas posidonica]AEF53253.1 Tetratricopeptide TPR_1 repeat-containing protein [Marinomonas posidonica IVIA-Po-181]
MLLEKNTHNTCRGWAITTLLLMGLTGCTSQVTRDGVPVIESAPYEAENAEEALKLAHLLRDNGRYKAAYEVYENMDEKGQLEEAFVLEYASLSASVLSPLEAIALFKRAELALEGDITSEQKQAICVGLGRAHLALSQFDQASSNFQCALQANPNSVVALNGMGVVLNRQGDFPEALKKLQKAIDLSPSSKLVVNNLSLTWLALGEHQKAISLLRTKHNNMAISTRLNLALVYVFYHREDMAREVLMAALPQQNTEHILDQYSTSLHRVENGVAVETELFALSNTPLKLKDVE